MRKFESIVLTPPGLPEPSIAISATRAGALGVLDLEYTQDKLAASVLDALATLARYAKNDYGIKLSSHALVAEEVAELISDLPRKPSLVILTCRELGDENLRVHEEQVQALHMQGFAVLWEAICLEEAQLGEQIEVDGTIAKGHESGGRIGEETTFVLLQRLLMTVSKPVYAQGGIGLHTASACYASGAAGVVLDSQLLLTRECPIPEEIKNRIATMDGSETAYFGHPLGEAYRVYSRPNLPVIDELRQLERRLLGDEGAEHKYRRVEEWRQAILSRAGWDSPEGSLLLLGQDAAFASPLAKRFVTVGGILEGIREAIDSHVQIAHDLRPLDEGSSLALSSGIRYPVFQGPMARISDTPSFAAAVADAGGLPFLAISLMPPDKLEELLEQTHRLLGERPWGVGLIGFLPPNLVSQQLKIICEHRPPFALIAGGRPRQNRPFEDAGITTYMHVPSTGLLEIFLKNGDKRFILEGRESGGHVGPRTSFVLWEAMIDKLLKYLSRSSSDAQEYHVLFAGGIHDALSASMVAVMAAPLAHLGVKIGIQMGTAYLFTEELARTGGITDVYQREAIECDGTVVLEVGPGHANRCIRTPFTRAFEQEKQKLRNRGKSYEEIRFALEQLNIGRLYIAAKGTAPADTDSESPKIVELSPEEQLERGVYMIGQVGAIKGKVYDIETLHHEVSVESTKLLEDLYQENRELRMSLSKQAQMPPTSDVAIIGMASVFPRAQSNQQYWENILNKVNTIVEVPKERWDSELYYDPNPRAKDKAYSKWGCFLDSVPFDPVEYGMPPNTIPSIEPLQLLTLEMVKRAFQDAGYSDRPFPRERASVIIGTGGGGADLAQGYGARSSFPMLFGKLSAEALSRFEDYLPEWTEDSFAGILMNVVAGRVANRFDLGGENYTVDAACASSLAAVHLGVKELNTYNSDVVVVGGADTMQNAFTYLCFSKTMALSPSGECRTLDERANGIVLGEGIAILILKRLEDAERDGDRIYAVIKAVGSSSDGRDKSMTAPRPEGQALALRRAYERAGVSPSTIELIEAHGTGTVAGDRAEIQALTQVFGGAGTGRQYCAIGSVKSMVGHTKCAAGVAGLIKAALALHHKVLPPTIGVQRPNPSANFSESPLYVNTETRPWIALGDGAPRRAGVSAFGFGGTNFHAVLEEYTGYEGNTKHAFPIQQWPSELFLWRGDSRQEIVEKIGALERSLSQELKSPSIFRDMAYSVHEGGKEEEGELCLAVVVVSPEDLRQKLARAREALTEDTEVNDPRGIFFTERPLAGTQSKGRVAFLFPGQGSQYVNMMIDLTIHFPELRAHFERANKVLSQKIAAPLSRYIFPQPWFTEEEKLAREQALRESNIAQPAIGAASMGMFDLLETVGIRPDFVAGHSYGEYVALSASGALNEEDLIDLSEARGRFIAEAAGKEPGTMAAINADVPAVTKVIGPMDEVYIANKNSPQQTVITGTEDGVKRAVEQFESQGILTKIIPVACAFHSPIAAPARERLARFLSGVELSAPKIEVFSNTTAGTYPKEPKSIADLLGEHLVSPVEFVQEILAMYEANARIFVEVGPRSVLTKLTGRILSDRPHLAVASDQPSRNGLTQLQRLLGQLAVHGIPVKLDRLFEGRGARLLDLSNLQGACQGNFPSTTWLVNGHRARPISEASKPEPIFPQVDLVVAGESEKPRKREDMKIEQGNPFSTEGRREETPGPSEHSVSSIAGDLRERKQNDRPQPRSAKPIERYAPRVTGDGAAQVMLQYQQLMSRFLDTQKSVMLAYLQNGRVQSDAEALTAQRAARRASLPGDMSQPTQILEPAQPEPSPQAQPMPSESLARTDPSLTGTDESGTSTPSSTETHDSVEQMVAVPEPARIEIPAKEELTERLLEIVSERTGYPTEMLDLDLDMEADLGIDSIKRIEILGSAQEFYDFEDSVGQAEDLQDEDAIEELASLKTLREIIDWLGERINAAVDAETATEAESGPAISTAATVTGLEDVTQLEPVADHTPPVEDLDDVVNRYTLTAVERPIQEESKISLTQRVLVLTDDEGGIASGLAESLRAAGHTVALVKARKKTQQMNPGSYIADLAKGGSITRLLRLIRQEQGPVGGLIHLLPLNGSQRTQGGEGLEEMDFASWTERLRLEVKSLFLFAKELGEELKEAALSGDTCFIAATGMGGTFASVASVSTDRDTSDLRLETRGFFPGQGGIPGLLKTIAHEWPNVRVKAIDLSNDDSISTHIDQIMQEISSDDGLVEVGYSSGRRVVLTPVSAPLDGTRLAIPNIDSSWVILVTGGARGITADVALELAQKYRPKLLLVGRSAFPEAEESSETAGLTTMQQLKAAIMEKMRESGRAVNPANVEEVYSRLLKDREMRENLSKMRSAGAEVHYYQADVHNEQEFSDLIDQIYQDFGRLDGVIHGAGIIEDKLIRDKSPESFDRVFDTKANSAFILSKKLRPAELSFLVIFSSVAGRFGNRGQSDYTAANEVYNKLAVYLDSHWPGRVVSIMWGPWARAGGMVSAELEKQFALHGVDLIPRSVGTKKLDEEICYGRKGEVEVILGGRGWDDQKIGVIEQERKRVASQALGSPRMREAEQKGNTETSVPAMSSALSVVGLPLIGSKDPFSREEDGSVRLIRTLDVARDIYLNDHRLDGKPVLPMAMAIEFMAETASLAWQEYQLSEIRDLQVLHGIMLDGDELDVQVMAKLLGSVSDNSSQEENGRADTGVEVEMSIASVEEPQRVCYRSKLELRKELPPPVSQMSIYLEEERPFPMEVQEAYRQWLFQGPIFQGITEIEGIGTNGILARLSPSFPRDCVTSITGQLATSDWIVDPVVVDSGLQLVILWARENLGMTPLPTRVLRHRRFGSMSDQKVECHVHVHIGSISNILMGKLVFFGEDGRLLGLMEGMEGICTKALNRLSVKG